MSACVWSSALSEAGGGAAEPIAVMDLMELVAESAGLGEAAS